MATQNTTPAAPEPQLAVPPKPPTPLDPPVVYYNQKWRVPPIVVDTQEAADALDPNEWTMGAPPAPSGTTKTAAKPEFPQLYANVNLPPRIVGDAGDAKTLGDEWQPFPLPQDLVAAAQKTLDAAKSTT